MKQFNFRKQLDNAYLPPRYDNSSLVLYQTVRNCPSEITVVPGLDTVDNVINVQDNWRGHLYQAILKAEKFIYVSVPSLDPNMLLILNDGDANKSLTIGELLNAKYRQGKR